MIGAFTWGAGGAAVPSDEAMKRRARISEMLLASGLSNQPAQHWSDGLARGVNILAAGYFDKQNRDDQAAAQAGLAPIRAAMLGESAPASSGVLPSVEAPKTNPLLNVQPMQGGDTLARSADAITGIESGGRYDALGPVTKSGDRAYGRYQVMGANIPSWTEQYAGRRMTPEEFAASPEAQDAVFKGEFGRLSQKYGPEGAARAWFAGEGGMNDPNRRDILGTSVADYSRKFTTAFGPMQEGQQAPRVAQAGNATPSTAVPSPSAPTAPSGGISQDRLRAAYNILNSPFAGPADKAVAQTIIQRALTAETKDPLDIRLKQLQVQQAEAQAQMTPLQRRQAEIGIQKGERELLGDGATPLTPEERAQYGITAEQPAYKTRTGEIKFGPAASRTQVAIDQRQESEFGKETGKALAQRFNALATEGDEAIQNQGMIDELRRLGGRINTGASAVLKDRLGQLGIKTEGVEEIQAFRSLVSRLTPQQRVPGSGATSDFDAKMFQDSLPSLINQPGGNALILDTIDKLNANKVARGDIAMRVQAGELTPREAVTELRKLQGEARALSDAVKERMKGGGAGNTTPAPQAPASTPAQGGFRILKVE